jgi:hypothetical protein
MYKRKFRGFYIPEKACFYKNDSKSAGNFIVGLLNFGGPILPDYFEKGINLKECRTIPSLKNYIKRYEMEHIKYFYEKLQKAMETGKKKEIRYMADGICSEFVSWSLNKSNIFKLNRPEYIYVLKKGTVYVSDDYGKSEYPMNEYFIMDLVENMDNFVTAACKNKTCLIKTTCTRSIKKGTLCPDAYSEIKEYVDNQLNA